MYVEKILFAIPDLDHILRKLILGAMINASSMNEARTLTVCAHARDLGLELGISHLRVWSNNQGHFGILASNLIHRYIRIWLLP